MILPLEKMLSAPGDENHYGIPILPLLLVPLGQIHWDPDHAFDRHVELDRRTSFPNHALKRVPNWLHSRPLEKHRIGQWVIYHILLRERQSCRSDGLIYHLHGLTKHEAANLADRASQHVRLDFAVHEVESFLEVLEVVRIRNLKTRDLLRSRRFARRGSMRLIWDKQPFDTLSRAVAR